MSSQANPAGSIPSDVAVSREIVNAGVLNPPGSPDWTTPLTISQHAYERACERVDPATRHRWGSTPEQIEAGIKAEIRAALALGRHSRLAPVWVTSEEIHRRRWQTYATGAFDTRCWVLIARPTLIHVLTVLTRRETMDDSYRLL